MSNEEVKLGDLDDIEFEKLLAQMDLNDKYDLLDAAIIESKLNDPNNFEPPDYKNKPKKFVVLKLVRERDEYNRLYHWYANQLFLGVCLNQYKVPIQPVTNIDGLLFEPKPGMTVDEFTDNNKKVISKYIEKETKAEMKKFIEHVYKYDPYKHFKAANDVITSDRKDRVDDIKEYLPRGMHCPSIEQLRSMTRFIKNHHESIRSVVSTFHNIIPSLENSVIVYDTFETEQQVRTFQEKYSKYFINDVIVIPERTWCVTGPFRENEKYVQIGAEDPWVSAMIEQRNKDKQIYEDLLKHRVPGRPKDMDPEVNELAEEYSKFQGSSTRMLSSTEKEALRVKKQNYDNEGVKETDDSIDLPIWVCKDKKLTRKVIKLKADEPRNLDMI